MVILSDQPLKVARHRPNASNQVAKWALKHFEFDLVFCPWPSLIVEVLTNFVTKCTILKEELVDNSVRNDPKNQWVINVDGSSNTSRSRVKLILTSPKEDIIQYALHFRFRSINNAVEYEALITGLKISKELRVQHLKAYSDSQLVVNHVLNEYESREKI